MIRPHNMCRFPLSWETPEELFEVAAARMQPGLVPPAEIYQIQYRTRFHWLAFPRVCGPSVRKRSTVAVTRDRADDKNPFPTKADLTRRKPTILPNGLQQLGVDGSYSLAGWSWDESL